MYWFVSVARSRRCQSRKSQPKYFCVTASTSGRECLTYHNRRGFVVAVVITVVNSVVVVNVVNVVDVVVVVVVADVIALPFEVFEKRRKLASF